MFDYRILRSWFMKESPYNWVFGLFIPNKYPKQPGSLCFIFFTCHWVWGAISRKICGDRVDFEPEHSSTFTSLGVEINVVEIPRELFYLPCAIEGAKEPGMMYFPTKGGAKEPQNPQNHRVAWMMWFLCICALFCCHVKHLNILKPTLPTHLSRTISIPFFFGVLVAFF